MSYDLIIIGGGPGGVAAGVYAARKKLKSVLITDFFGGQSSVSADIQNWIGVKSISGFEFAKMLEDHLRAQENIEILEDFVLKITPISPINPISPISPISPINLTSPPSPTSPLNPTSSTSPTPPLGFSVFTKSGKTLETKTVLICTGSRRRKLNIPGEKEFEGRGVFYCSVCDAPLMKNKTVAVIGGGNAGLEAVVDLLPYAKKIYLLEYSNKLKGDPLTQEKIKNNPKVEIIFNAATKEILGQEFVTALKYIDLQTSQYVELKVEGIFVEIGSVPNSELVKDLVQLNQFGEIVVDPKTQRTSQEGIWAAGDVTDGLYKQNNISAGDAIKAVLNIYEYLNK